MPNAIALLSALPFSVMLWLTFALDLRAETCPELPGFAPPEGLPVYNGACLYGAEDPGFSRYALPTGPMKSGAPVTSEPLEGVLQRRLYVAPEGTSPTDLFLNYRTALTGLGYDILFECTGRACGSNNALLGKLVIYPVGRFLDNLGQDSEYALNIDGDEQFLAARSADGLRHIAVYVAQNKGSSISGGAANRAAVHIDLVTAEALQTQMVDAAAMAKGITDEGHVAVDNVYFEFGTAVLTPEAAPALAEMVKFLTTNPEVKVFVVGHTDWVGDADANLTLSQNRAASVVAALIAGLIAPDRVTPAGAGLYSPRASNATEAGRALNRRVELVER